VVVKYDENKLLIVVASRFDGRTIRVDKASERGSGGGGGGGYSGGGRGTLQLPNNATRYSRNLTSHQAVTAAVAVVTAVVVAAATAAVATAAAKVAAKVAVTVVVRVVVSRTPPESYHGTLLILIEGYNSGGGGNWRSGGGGGGYGGQQQGGYQGGQGQSSDKAYPLQIISLTYSQAATISSSPTAVVTNKVARVVTRRSSIPTWSHDPQFKSILTVPTLFR
jgi:hypothetical protein